VDSDQIKPEKGRKYNIVTREYMAQGHDGYLALKGNKCLIDDEVGQMFSTLVRQYLLGSRYVNKMARLADRPYLHADTKGIIGKERQRRKRHDVLNESKRAQSWQHATTVALRSRSYAHYKDQINVCAREHMSEVDCFDGGKARRHSVGDVKHVNVD